MFIDLHASINQKKPFDCGPVREIIMLPVCSPKWERIQPFTSHERSHTMYNVARCMINIRNRHTHMNRFFEYVHALIGSCCSLA